MKKNKILIPKKLCHLLNKHVWFYKSRNHSLISKSCKRCGMSGLEYAQIRK